MEKNELQKLTPQYLYSLIKNNAGKIEALERKTTKHDRQFTDIEEEYPLLPPEADDLANAVKKKGVEVLGGKKSPAYKNVELRRKLYMDIYGQLKREYGLINERGAQLSYKKLKRKYLGGAFLTVEAYEPSVALTNEIEAENEIDDEC